MNREQAIEHIAKVLEEKHHRDIADAQRRLGENADVTIKHRDYAQEAMAMLDATVYGTAATTISMAILSKEPGATAYPPLQPMPPMPR